MDSTMMESEFFLESNNYSASSQWDTGVFPLESEKSFLSSNIQKSMPSAKSSAKGEAQTLTKINSLMQDVHQQWSIVKQASRAVEACLSSKALINSDVHIEAERILLAADLRGQLLAEKLSKFEHKEGTKRNRKIKGARVQISDLEFPLTGSARKKKTYFVIVCYTDAAMQVSPVITAEAGSQFLNYPEGFTFNNLFPESIISFRIFQLNTRNRTSSWSWFNCFKSNDVCARPTKNVYYKDVYNGKLRQVEVLHTSFTLAGSKDLILGECINNDTFLLTPPSESLLYGVLKMKTDVSSVSAVREHFGFVSLGIELRGYIVWDRKWCRLVGPELRFWDSPAEEHVNTPKLILNLKNHMHQEVHVTKKKHCKRPRILSLEFAVPDLSDQYNLVAKKYHIGVDSVRDIHVWKSCIQSVLSTQELKKLFGCTIDI